MTRKPKRKARVWWILVQKDVHPYSRVDNAYTTKAWATGNACKWHDVVRVEEVLPKKRKA